MTYFIERSNEIHKLSQLLIATCWKKSQIRGKKNEKKKFLPNDIYSSMVKHNIFEKIKIFYQALPKKI